jgi:hypothetical protein
MSSACFFFSDTRQNILTPTCHEKKNIQLNFSIFKLFQIALINKLDINKSSLLYRESLYHVAFQCMG